MNILRGIRICITFSENNLNLPKEDNRMKWGRKYKGKGMIFFSQEKQISFLSLLQEAHKEDCAVKVFGEAKEVIFCT